MTLYQKIAVAVAVALIAVGVYVDAVLLPDAEPKLGPTVDGVASEREAGKKLLERNFSQIEKAVPELDRSAEAFANSCDEGQQNYKVDEGFKYKCTYKVTRFYGFASEVSDLERWLYKSLNSDRWKTAGGVTPHKVSNKMKLELTDSYTGEKMPPFYPGISSIAGDGLDFPAHEQDSRIDVEAETQKILSEHRYALGVEIEIIYYLRK